MVWESAATSEVESARKLINASPGPLYCSPVNARPEMLTSRLHAVPGEHADPGRGAGLADAGEGLDLSARPGSLYSPTTAVLSVRYGIKY